MIISNKLAESIIEHLEMHRFNLEREADNTESRSHHAFVLKNLKELNEDLIIFRDIYSEQ